MNHTTLQSSSIEKSKGVKYDIQNLLHKRRISLKLPRVNSLFDEDLKAWIISTIESWFKTEMKNFSSRPWYQKALLDIIKETTNHEEKKLLLEYVRNAIGDVLKDGMRYNNQKCEREPCTCHGIEWENVRITLLNWKKIEYFVSKKPIFVSKNGMGISENVKQYLESQAFTNDEYLDMLKLARDYFNELGAWLNTNQNTIGDFEKDKKFMDLFWRLMPDCFWWPKRDYENRKENRFLIHNSPWSYAFIKLQEQINRVNYR